MFGNVIYYDKEKIDTYKTVISGKRNLEVKEYEVSDDRGITLGLKAIGADAKASKSYKAHVQESLLFDCDEFEKMLSGRDDFLDFTQSEDYSINTSCRGQIIKFNGYISVPEAFDLTQTIGRFKPMLYDSITNNDMDESEKVALELFLETPNIKIPVLIKFDEQLMYSKLVSENMKVKYEEMDDYEDLEVTIIARVTSSCTISSSKPYYDPLKDFMALNRAMRRSLEERTDGINELYADEDYRTIEVLAVYQ